MLNQMNEKERKKENKEKTERKIAENAIVGNDTHLNIIKFPHFCFLYIFK